MLKYLILFVVIAGIAFVGGSGLITRGVDTLAYDEGGCDEANAKAPFMGMSDPNAPDDLRFIDEMIMHHQGAIMSSKMMIADSEHPELRDLARRIQESQQRQIDQMRAWRTQWYPDAPFLAADMEPIAGMMTGMMGSGQSDQMFLQMMIPHHQLAVEMAEGALVNAEHEAVRPLAQEIIEGQSAEITEMEGYLRDWYDDRSTRNAAGAMGDMMRSMMGTC